MISWFPLLLDQMLESLVNSGQLDMEYTTNLKEALLLRKRHQHESINDQKLRNRLPIVRSLADIGRASSKSMFGSHSKFPLALSTLFWFFVQMLNVNCSLRLYSKLSYPFFLLSCCHPCARYKMP